MNFDSCLICRLTALEAKAAGLVSRVVYTDQLMAEARSMASRIASLSALAVAKAKDCINRAYELPLSEGLRYEQYVHAQTLHKSWHREGRDWYSAPISQPGLKWAKCNPRKIQGHRTPCDTRETLFASPNTICLVMCYLAGASSGLHLQRRTKKRACMPSWTSGNQLSRIGSWLMLHALLICTHV